MDFAPVEKLAAAVLYEGYILYPYRPSSLKNQKRFNFGVLAPPAYSALENGTESFSMQTQCLVEAGPRTRLAVEVRFLQPARVGSWMEAMERSVGPLDYGIDDLTPGPLDSHFDFREVRGVIEVGARCLQDRLFQLTVRVSNETTLDDASPMDRDHVLPHSCASTHTILGLERGAFVSLLEPPEQFREAASACSNIGTWPILIGKPGDRRFMLSSPIILYDYACVAPESPWDLCDAAEIDEILTLRILTMTDEEKREMRQADDHGRRILERIESLPPEDLIKLHGVLRELPPGGWERK
jgi:hydrogenase maturation protease